MEPTLVHRFEHALFRGVSSAASLLPGPAAGAAGGALGWLAGSVLRIRRKVVERNLARAFPDRPPEWRRSVARASYRHVGRESVAMLRMASMDRQRVLAGTRVVGLEAVREALGAGAGAILVSGHLGNWEIGGAAVSSRGIPLSAVALRQGNPLFDRDLVRTRERLGMEVIYRGDAPRAVLEALRRGRAVALVADQNPLRGGIPIEFFGRTANTSRGPAVLAIRSGAPLFLGLCFRQKEHLVLELQRVTADRTGDTEEDVRALVEAYTSLLEEGIRRRPEQYFWFHRRWKRRAAAAEGSSSADSAVGR